MERKFIVTLNGKPFTIVENGEFAVNADGRMVKLADMPKESRFR